MATVGVLLAAGEGSRFAALAGGRDKLLEPSAPGAHTSVVGAAAALLTSACEHVVAVVRPGQDGRRAALEACGCDVVESSAAAGGMGYSLGDAARAAIARYSPDLLVVLLGDLPYVRTSTLRSLLSAAHRPEVRETARVVVPTRDGRRGHPVVFSRPHFDALCDCAGERGAAALIARFGTHAVEVDDRGILHDIDTPEDLSATRAVGDDAHE